MNLVTAVKSLVVFSIPIIFGQLGQMLIGAGDVYIASLYSTNSVAAIGLANGVFNPIYLFGLGLTMGVSPILANLRGEKKEENATLATIIFYATISGLLLTFLTLFLNQLVPYLGFDPKIVPSIMTYIDIVAWSIPFGMIFHAIKEYLQSYEEVFVPNLMSIIAVVLNLILNYILVFGLGSFSGYGEVGLAIASLSMRIFLCFFILLYILRHKAFKKINYAMAYKLLKFSFPIAFMFFLEVLAFCTVTILSGRIGIISAAANNIIMTIASIAFMVPLSISSAIGVKIGHAYGEKNKEKILNFAKASILITALFIIVSASSFFIFPNAILTFVTKDLEVIKLGVQLLVIVAFFQISDASQVVLIGILRGLKNTKISFLMILIGYWLIGIPLGYFLAFHKGMDSIGLWIGLATSLTFCAVFLSLYTYSKIKKITS